MTNETTIATMAPAEDAQHAIPADVMEKVVIGGDLSELNAAQRAEYYAAVCRSLGLNPLTKPGFQEQSAENVRLGDTDWLTGYCIVKTST